ncbi:SDR family NAD(P)-dependent oxidoreductase [Nonomuraea angiospora]|uniref:SDR family NAD(P)-dependent oxidoreductase n=1 Tax=Nonomuraea angiospora TaxID=46172 RepID=UPI0029A78039|nr:SDR family NAD(P)-dependent oxidoreductase [Nonomuraea angiospora]MDX3109059.1 SDR family NAD(P)-dependent oxidoreductase [Nonomuraea angiospora]
MNRFDNRTVLITGAAGGMGASHARGFLGEGANVMLTDIREERGRVSAYSLMCRGKYEGLFRCFCRPA